MSDKDDLPAKGIPAYSLVDENGVSTDGTSASMNTIRSRGMQPICEVNSSGVATSGSTMNQLRSRGIRFYCAVTENAVTSDAVSLNTLRGRGVPFFCPVDVNGIAVGGTATLKQLEAKGLPYACLLDSAGSVGVSGTLIAGAGSYAWTGQNATLTVTSQRSVAAGAGSYAWTGDDMTPLQDHFVTASGGSYTWTGQDATLTKSGGSLGLQTNLTGFWSLENTSWLDDTASGTTLTGTGTPTVSAGKVGNAVDLDGSTDGLSAVSNANIVTAGGSFSVQAWINIPSGVPGERLIFNKSNDAFGQFEWGLGSRFTSSNQWVFTCSNTSTTHFRADSAVTVASGWHHLVGTFNSSGGAMLIYVDGSVAGAGQTLTGTVNSSASAPLGIGKHAAGLIQVACLIDQCGFWKGRVLSAGDVTALYNSGNGLSYAAMA